MARRFHDEKAIYGERVKNFSLVDINGFFKAYNGAPRLDKFSYRPDFFQKKEDTEEEALYRKYRLMKPVMKEGGDPNDTQDI